LARNPRPGGERNGAATNPNVDAQLNTVVRCTISWSEQEEALMAIDQPAPRRRVTVAELRAHRDEIARIGSRYGISDIRVFGSVARGDARDDSDLDLLVEIAPGRGYFDLAGFALDIEQLLGVYTEVATAHGVKPRIRSKVLAEAIRL
jgi:uncharacterized protein